MAKQSAAHQSVKDAARSSHLARPLPGSTAQVAMSNQATQQQLRAGLVQRKLTVSEPQDRYEQEADHVAETVMRMRDPVAQTAWQGGEPPPIQRKCTACEEEELQRKPLANSHQFGAEFNHPTSGGQRLPESERNFFEPRFGRDFSHVRVHAGGEAGKAARSVSALAYTMGNDIVFGEGQYRPGTDSGRSVLAHELAHVVQQGAAGPTVDSLENSDSAPPAISRIAESSPPSVQRLGDVSQVPPTMICPVAVDNPANVDTAVLFSLGSAVMTPAGIAAVSTFVARWNAAGANKPVRVDGYASTDGSDSTNWTLSCDRALMVEAELMAPTGGGAGVPFGQLSHFAQGETSEFGASLPLNRRATISSDITAPPLPACANPGVSRTLDLQPVFLRTSPADANPTGRSWIRRFNESNVVWGKLGVTFTERTPITIDTPLKTGGATVADQTAIRALSAGAGVEIFLVDNNMPDDGGGITEGAPLAARCVVGNIIMSDRGTSDTLLAHELGHILGIRHPGVAPNPGDPNTIMEPSDSNNANNPTRNTLANFAAILCPAASGTTCLHPDP
jgi:outer membrane protein OmpA-like peptidoglycan-associated protein